MRNVKRETSVTQDVFISENENAPIRAIVSEKEQSRAFWAAWNEHRDYLRRLSLMWMNVSHMDAEDALSLATLRAHEKYAEHAENIKNERAWFARLLHNICIDLHRSNKRRFRLKEKVKEVVEIDNSPLENVELSPEGELMNTELGKAILLAIDKLPANLQAPLVMRLIEGDDYKVIAERLNISNDNARKRVQQARSILRRQLGSLR
ncbi:sigma-70 family RNA polymerase sigma factor [Sneathiella sp. P13V-1]|uniref:RNA polymerase sigma factor n=1 Tax=Sneathiella sp. P13V-1 TaxID=2697366 RepID=UPI00187B50A7|nr:RNA polymerase sigma factor [Sneathiella sp. P13V-1]MBE7637835.1 sigma-70 family RNA polymerase sigma factor [Sneathiella sp. P13V-1]